MGAEARRWVVATRNRHKLDELGALLAGLPVALSCVADHPGAPDVEETAPDFAGNALLKARSAARATGLWALADDSGLEVDALDGRPGVLSARYAGVQGDHAANNARLLADLAAVPEARRAARFVCVLALARPDGAAWRFRGECPGAIAHAARGAGGFGYDPLFLVSDAAGRTMAELDAAAKNRISHRGRALAALRAALPDLLAGRLAPTDFP
ncbi:MAG: RdgB/HAM1 family non-canonical purine NTP pyrophosphatase [Planctomycetes bacterium]|nr:RdgB/HAM1 family non-canonical purine NTP pyrophosphatase [Planctomycetota bacterium]